MMQDGGGKRFHRKTSVLMTEINVTPFVDVMLVLLIIFMVTAPLLNSGIELDLPKEKAGSLEIKEENVVSLRKDGAFFFNDKRISPPELADILKNIVANAPKTEVYLRADQSLRYGMVIKAMGLIKSAGVDRLGMITEPPTNK